jgi:RNA polymerase sigma factor (sigma-70 family)
VPPGPRSVPDGVPQRLGVHGDLEQLLTIDGDHRNPGSVVAHELVCRLDVDLLEAEPLGGSDGLDHGPRLVAEVTSGAGEQDDGRHGWQDTQAMHDPAEDLELHRRLLEGDRTAFDELYRHYAGQAYGLAYRVTGQQILAQDVVHDAYMALWRAPEAFDPARGSFRTFFLSMVHHRGVDLVRREQRLRARTEKAANLEPATDEDPAEAVAEAGYLTVRRKEVREAMNELPAPQRQVLEMAYFSGKTQVQIAEELAIPLGTVKTRTLAAMRKLRAALEETA